MAYTFSRAAIRYLRTTAPVTATPLTISAWSYPTAAPGGYTPRCSLITLEDSATDNRFELSWNSFANNRAVATVSGPVPGGGVTSGTAVSGAVTLNTWQHLAAVFVGRFERYAYFNGLVSAPGTNGLVPAGIDRLLIGTSTPGTTDSQHIGRIAEVGIWNAALTSAEIISLYAGMSPELVRPQSLVFYAPLIRDLHDKVGGRVITNVNSASISDHSRIYT